MESAAPLKLRVTSRLREWLKKQMEQSQLNNPIPGLKFARWNDETEDHWMVGFFERSQISEIEKTTLAQGYRAFYVTDGIELIFYQLHLLPEIEGKTLDLGNNGVYLT